jgi:hypothetical protein
MTCGYDNEIKGGYNHLFISARGNFTMTVVCQKDPLLDGLALLAREEVKKRVLALQCLAT